MSADRDRLAASAKDIANTHPENTYASYYLKALEKILAKPGYAGTEIKRLSKIILAATASNEKLDDFTIRRNILESLNVSVGDIVNANEEL